MTILVTYLIKDNQKRTLPNCYSKFIILFLFSIRHHPTDDHGCSLSPNTGIYYMCTVISATNTCKTCTILLKWVSSRLVTWQTCWFWNYQLPLSEQKFCTLTSRKLLKRWCGNVFSTSEHNYRTFNKMVSGRFAYGLFRLRIESIRLRLICQFAYESDVEALKLNY